MDILKDITALPWEMCDRGDYSDFDGQSNVMLGDDRRIAVVQNNGCEETEANARYIVQACNSFPVLVEALTKIHDCGDSDLGDYCAIVDEIACEALAKLEAQS